MPNDRDKRSLASYKNGDFVIVSTQQGRTPPADCRVIAVRPEGIPQPLKDRRQWVVWKLEERGGKQTKVPYSPWTGERASTNDLMTWATFEEALAVYHGGEYQGIGFVFSSADPFVGVDLEDCRDPETGDVKGWARRIIEKLPDAYVEVSPSGRGVHIITRGRLREGKRKGSVEIYGQDRFFTVTGVGA